jgi:hypothetical protein
VTTPGGVRIGRIPGTGVGGMDAIGDRDSLSPPATSQLPSLLILGRVSPGGMVSAML